MKLWDYLIVTASNETQAAAYRAQLEMRRSLGLLHAIRETLVVPDPKGMRIGSGGSTIWSLLDVLRRELNSDPGAIGRPDAWSDVLRRRRILILHAGGDSRRLPAYGPCGKLFTPMPVDTDSSLPTTLFDLQLTVYLDLPLAAEGVGQVVIASGDVLLEFDSHTVRWRSAGITGLACFGTPEEASRHGVYYPQGNGQVRRFVQKPSVQEQGEQGAIDRYGRSLLDIGLFWFDAGTAVALLHLCDVRPSGQKRLVWTGPMGEAIERYGLDFYRELACAIGTETTRETHRQAALAAGSCWDAQLLERIFATISATAFQAQTLRRCKFRHFGTTRQLISSGQAVLRDECIAAELASSVSVNNVVGDGISFAAVNAWVEGCRVESALNLVGNNVLVGVDVDQPLSLPPRGCLDLLPGHDRRDAPAVFVRCYHDNDFLRQSPALDLTWCGLALRDWLERADMLPGDLWDGELSPATCSMWDARLFPAVGPDGNWRQWLWLLSPETASTGQWEQWKQAERYSLREMAERADLNAFLQRRSRLRCELLGASLHRRFRLDSNFSAGDVAEVLRQDASSGESLLRLLEEAGWQRDNADVQDPDQAFSFARIVHSLGTALAQLTPDQDSTVASICPGLARTVQTIGVERLKEWGLQVAADRSVSEWTDSARQAAFQHVRQVILASGQMDAPPPRNALRADEIVWGRAPARIDLAGGWTDTPPYSLEHGGCVLNAAVLLNGQPPIQAYARVTSEPLIRVRSIDVGTQLEIRRWEDLLDYCSATGEFSLIKAALVQCGFRPNVIVGPHTPSLEDALASFGGGLELTTLAAIPKGSGLGTSSIMGAVLLAVIHRVMGRTLSPDELFHAVLRLEQALTTGGGWQDQIGGSVGGLKLITTSPGLVPQATIRYVPADIVDSQRGEGHVLLYYTGITRLAKNILEQVVGRYLDRTPETLHSLRCVAALARHCAEAIGRRDYREFGQAVQEAWELNKRLDPNSSTEEIEILLDRVRPHIYGAKLAGAGGGGFLLMVCRSAEDASQVRRLLESRPPNLRARFFDFAISHEGLAVSRC
jgi:fucokinase